jgi:isopentenyl-diphosphate delta-isomerase type 1
LRLQRNDKTHRYLQTKLCKRKQDRMSSIVSSIETVILVNEHDQEVGTEEKMLAHKMGLLHRAFSVFIYRRQDNNLEFLLQRRQLTKYHCGGLWTNTCCSHPRLQESVQMAAERRLKEEMSLSIPLTVVGSFIYQASFDNGLIEHEFDHVLIGEYLREKHENDSIQVDPQEVLEYRWIGLSELQQELKENPKLYTPWLKPALEIALTAL